MEDLKKRGWKLLSAFSNFSGDQLSIWGVFHPTRTSFQRLARIDIYLDEGCDQRLQCLSLRGFRYLSKLNTLVLKTFQYRVTKKDHNWLRAELVGLLENLKFTGAKLKLPPQFVSAELLIMYLRQNKSIDTESKLSEDMGKLNLFFVAKASNSRANPLDCRPRVRPERNVLFLFRYFKSFCKWALVYRY